MKSRTHSSSADKRTLTCCIPLRWFLYKCHYQSEVVLGRINVHVYSAWCKASLIPLQPCITWAYICVLMYGVCVYAMCNGIDGRIGGGMGLWGCLQCPCYLGCKKKTVKYTWHIYHHYLNSVSRPPLNGTDQTWHMWQSPTVAYRAHVPIRSPAINLLMTGAGNWQRYT